MIVTAKKIDIYELESSNGTLGLGLFRVVSQWQGMQKLQSISRTEDVLIVAGDHPQGYESTFKEIFATITGDPFFLNFRIIFASPDLAIKLRTALGGEVEKL